MRMRTVTLGLVVAVLSWLAWVPAAPAASGTEDGDSATVTLESVLPVIPKPKSKLRISGRVANSGDLPIENPVVRLRVSPDPLVSRSEVPLVLDGSSARNGVLVSGVQVELGEELQPGQSLPFTVRVPMAKLSLRTAPAVYAAFVEVAAGSIGLARAGATIPWFPAGSQYAPSGVSLLWPLTQRPDVAADRLVLNPKLPGEFASGGRLDGLLRAGQGTQVSWLVDAATLETAKGLSDGYRVQTSQGAEPVDESADAARFLADLRKVVKDQTVALPGFAIADADALDGVGMKSFTVRSASLPGVIGSTELPGSELNEVFLAPGGRLDDATLRVLVDAGVRTIVASDKALPPAQLLNYTPTGAAQLGADGESVEFLLIDTPLSASLARPLASAGDRFLARHGFLSDLAMLTLERPNQPRNVIAQVPLLWDPPQEWTKDLLDSVERIPWTSTLQLDEVNSGPLVERGSLRYGGRARKAELPADYLRRIAGLDRSLQSMTALVDDPVGFGETFTLALQRATSSLWRQDIEGRDKLVRTISSQLERERRKVQVISKGNVTLAGDNGVLPLTIANDLDRSVTVGLELRTENQIRLLYDQPDPVKINGSQKAGLEVPIRVVGSQPLEVSVVLTDKAGRFYDESVTIQLQSTASSRIASVFVGAAAVVFVVLVGIRIYRRRQHVK